VAARAVAALAPAEPVALIVVLGGHLGRRDPLVTMSRGAWQTPYGWLPIHTGFAEALGAFDNVVDETQQGFLQDNSIEVQLPIVHRRFPAAELLPIRVPPNSRALALGEALGHYLEQSGLSAVVLASTDLTHYGPAYGFTPAGPLPGAREWMTQNDQGFIDAVSRVDGTAVLDAANRHHSACSAGSVAAAWRGTGAPASSCSTTPPAPMWRPPKTPWATWAACSRRSRLPVLWSAAPIPRPAEAPPLVPRRGPAAPASADSMPRLRCCGFNAMAWGVRWPRWDARGARRAWRGGPACGAGDRAGSRRAQPPAPRPP